MPVVETRVLVCGKCGAEASALGARAIARGQILDVCETCWGVCEAEYVAQCAALGIRGVGPLVFSPVVFAGPSVPAC